MTNQNIIINEQDIIRTYNLKQQEQCKLYKKFIKLRKKNPKWGHKRLATNLGIKYEQVAWWYFKRSSPISIQTTKWLKSKKLIPFDIKHPKFQIITRILGTTFGDGGIFKNLNGIFLSSSELGSVKQFKKDLNMIFEKEIKPNSRIIEGGEYRHSYLSKNK
jgi:hypothetical protein